MGLKHAPTNSGGICSIVRVVNKCLDEEINVFKHTIQDVVDELEVCDRCHALLRPAPPWQSSLPALCVHTNCI